MDYNRIYEGDKVFDPMDGEIREVAGVVPYDDKLAAVHMTDGGVMSNEEINEVYLAGEI